MEGELFENKIATLSFSYLPPPSFKEMFFKVFQMNIVQNEHMNDVFIPSWVSFLYEYIYISTNKITFQGWMFVTQKPDTKWNEHHGE